AGRGSPHGRRAGARCVQETAARPGNGFALCEEPDTMRIKGWLVPPVDANFIKTVCVTGSRSKDPHALGSGGDADTASCRSWPAISAKSGAPIGCCCCLASHRL